MGFLRLAPAFSIYLLKIQFDTRSMPMIPPRCIADSCYSKALVAGRSPYLDLASGDWRTGPATAAPAATRSLFKREPSSKLSDATYLTAANRVLRCIGALESLNGSAAAGSGNQSAQSLAEAGLASFMRRLDQVMVTLLMVLDFSRTEALQAVEGERPPDWHHNCLFTS